MLFPYRYINHTMEKMQEFIDYIFYEVWCKAPGTEYDLSLFNDKPELREVITNFHYTEPKGAEFFTKGIHKIFNIFKQLEEDDIIQLQKWYAANNNIEKLCQNYPSVIPGHYEVLKQLNPELSHHLKDFFTKLYSNEFLSKKALSSVIGHIAHHYKEFVKINNKGKCPYCGISDIDGEYVHTREAYDHFIPKSKYPFSTMNFKNLAPMCHKCNSDNKLRKDPLHDGNCNRRKAFYSYNSKTYKVDIKISLTSNDIEHLSPDDITITFGPPDLSEELNTWNDLFEIEERYKAKCCTDCKWWIEQLMWKGETDIFPTILRSAENYPYTDMNFLKKPFLEECKAKKIV